MDEWSGGCHAVAMYRRRVVSAPRSSSINSPPCIQTANTRRLSNCRRNTMVLEWECLCSIRGSSHLGSKCSWVGKNTQQKIEQKKKKNVKLHADCIVHSVRATCIWASTMEGLRMFSLSLPRLSRAESLGAEVRDGWSDSLSACSNLRNQAVVHDAPQFRPCFARPGSFGLCVDHRVPDPDTYINP